MASASVAVEGISLPEVVYEDLHPGIDCRECGKHIGGVRYMCIICSKPERTFDYCELCQDATERSNSHFASSHPFAKIRNSTLVPKERLISYMRSNCTVCQQVPCVCHLLKREYDAFSFSKTCDYDNNDKALDLIKRMLRVENKYRLSEEYISQYAQHQEDEWKTSVTEAIQIRVITEFSGEADGYWTTVSEGLRFLRSAVGNFPGHLPELMECANYVRFTQNCRRGHLRVGDTIDIDFPLYDPHTLEKEMLSAYLDSDKPLVVIASSYT